MLAVLVEFVRRDLANLQPPEVYRRAVVQRTQVRGLQGEKAAGNFAGYHRRRFERHEIALALFRTADFHADIGPGDESAQPRDVGARYARPHDPELRVFDQKALRLGSHLDRSLHAQVIFRISVLNVGARWILTRIGVAQLDSCDGADVNAIVVD